MRHFWICVSVVFLLLSNAVALHCRSMGLVIQAHPPAPGREMTPEQAYHHREMNRHAILWDLHNSAGDQARAQAGRHKTQAQSAEDPREQGRHWEACALNFRQSLIHYDAAMHHNAQAIHHQRLALGPRPNLWGLVGNSGVCATDTYLLPNFLSQAVPFSIVPSISPHERLHTRIHFFCLCSSCTIYCYLKSSILHRNRQTEVPLWKRIKYYTKQSIRWRRDIVFKGSKTYRYQVIFVVLLVEGGLPPTTFTPPSPTPSLLAYPPPSTSSFELSALSNSSSSTPHKCWMLTPHFKSGWTWWGNILLGVMTPVMCARRPRSSINLCILHNWFSCSIFIVTVWRSISLYDTHLKTSHMTHPYEYAFVLSRLR